MSSTEERTFVLSEKQMNKFKEWKKDKGQIYAGTVGGAYTICFTPTGIGDFVEVKCVDGTKLDLTEYDLL
jgi:hypothetical protein